MTTLVFLVLVPLALLAGMCAVLALALLALGKRTRWVPDAAARPVVALPLHRVQLSAVLHPEWN